MQELNDRFDQVYNSFDLIQKEIQLELLKQDGVWKVMTLNDYKVVESTGFIPNQPADIDCPYVHACDYSSILSVIKKFYGGIDKHKYTVDAFALNIEQAAKEGFTIKYESNTPEGKMYWHLYRPETEPGKLLSSKCLL